MQRNAKWGVAVGALVAIVAWFGDAARDSGVSLFPDLISLIVFAILANVAFGRTLGDASSWNEAARAVFAFGFAAGLVLAVVTLVRGSLSWNSTGLALGSATLVGSLFVVVLLSCSIGFLAFYTRVRRARLTN